jgi:predicted O-methyltransferase YrrM
MEGIKKLQRLIDQVKSFKLDWNRVKPYLSRVNEGSLNDINSIESRYYRYLPAVVDILKPKQVVELGSAGGASTLMMLSYLPNDSKMYACSVPEPEGEFRFIDERKYPNLTLVRGNDLYLTVWPEECDLRKTDLWFIDTEHSYQQLSNEMRLYQPYFKPGAIAFLDDIRLNEGMARAWNEIKYPKLSLPDWHSYSGAGFGVFICE